MVCIGNNRFKYLLYYVNFLVFYFLVKGYYFVFYKFEYNKKKFLVKYVIVVFLKKEEILVISKFYMIRIINCFGCS